MSMQRVFVASLAIFAVLAGVFVARQEGVTIGRANAPTATAPPTATAKPMLAAAPTRTPVIQRIIGIVTIAPGFHYDGGQGAVCHGQGGYDDLRSGAQVVVADSAGAIIATGQLEIGTVSLIPQTPYWGQCSFLMTVENVPYSAFYTFSISHRAGPTYSYADLAAAGFHVNLSIGS